MPQATDNVSQQRGAVDAELLALRPRALWRSFWQQHFAFICCSLYLLLLYLKPDQSYPIFAVLPLLRIALVATIAGFFLDANSKLRPSPFHWLLLLFLLQCWLSTLFAYDRSYAFDNLDVIDVYVLIYFLTTAIVSSERRLFLFLIVYFLANFKMSQFGFFTSARRGFRFASWGITGAGWFRNSGEFGLEMAMFFAYTLCLAMFLRKYCTGWVRYLMYFAPLTALVCVVESSSRGAVIAVIGTLSFLALFSNKQFKVWLGCASLICLGYLFMPARLLARFYTAGHDDTSLTRLDYWAKARIMMAQHPIFGVGYYNWVPYYRDHYFDPRVYWTVEVAHNTYLQIGAELGYVGLGLFVAMVVLSFVMNAKSAKIAGERGHDFLRCFAIAMNAAGIALVLASTFLTAFWLPNFWLHFALTACLSQIVNAKNAAPTELNETTSLRGSPPRGMMNHSLPRIGLR